MPRSKGQSALARFFASRLFLVVALILLIFISLSYARAYYKDYRVRQQITQLQYEVQQLEQNRIESLDILEYVTSDAFVEEKARTELNMQLPGEHVFVVDDSGLDLGERGGANSSTHGQNVINPIKWWHYFFGSRQST
jgi:cell division protein FtsB